MNGTENFTLLDLFNYHHKYQYTVKQMKEENLQNHHFFIDNQHFFKAASIKLWIQTGVCRAQKKH